MSVDTVVSAVAVTPKHDAQGNSGRNPRQEDSGKGRLKRSHHSANDAESVSGEPHSLVNCYGQVIGQTVNITA